MVPVLNSENDPKVVGIVTDRDLCIAVVAAGRDPRQVRVEECMTDEIVSLRPDEDVEDAADLMAEKQIRRLPVVNEHGAILGVVSLADLAQIPEQSSEVGDTLHDVSERTSEASVPRSRKES